MGVSERLAEGALRFSLGQAHLNGGRADRAAEHLREAVRHDPDYSAAWKLLGRALDANGQDEEAAAAFEQGIAVATGKGDRQAAKEMEVFLRRVRRRGDA